MEMHEESTIPFNTLALLQINVLIEFVLRLNQIMILMMGTRSYNEIVELN